MTGRVSPAPASNFHASVVAFGRNCGVLISGPSGAGKSRLALALMERGAQLVSDDQVMLCADGGQLYARPPHTIAGRIEARGLGLLQVPHCRLARVKLVVELGADPTCAKSLKRLPDPARTTLAGVSLDCLTGVPDTWFARALATQLIHRASHPVQTE